MEGGCTALDGENFSVQIKIKANVYSVNSTLIFFKILKEQPEAEFIELGECYML